jgi:hypothetical protein
MKPLLPSHLPGNTEAERLDNAVRRMFSISKEDVMKAEAKEKRARDKRRAAKKPH